MKRAGILLSSLGVFWWIGASLIHTITPREMTLTAIGESFSRIHIFAKANNKLPESMTELPRRDGYLNRTTDGWSQELLYEVSNVGIVSLSSYGADRKPGGIGEDADITRTYQSIDENGRFIAGDEMWIVHGEIPIQNERKAESQTHKEAKPQRVD